MEKKQIELVIHSFKGSRFEDHGLDIDVLSELITYKTLLVETAKELWRRNNPERQRLPRNFEESLSLKFYELREGSTDVPLVREIEFDPNGLPWPPPPDELNAAVELVAEVEDATNKDRALPEAFPKRLLPEFKDYGKSLREDEYMEQMIPSKNKTVRYDGNTRSKIQEWSEKQYDDQVDLTGEVRTADLDGCNFKIKVDDGTKVSGKFSPEQEQTVVLALLEHQSKRMRVRGRGEFNPSDGKLVRITVIDELTMQPEGERIFDPDARPIWQIAKEIGESIPEEEWAKLPSDLSINHDHYLYGAPKVQK